MFPEAEVLWIHYVNAFVQPCWYGWLKHEHHKSFLDLWLWPFSLLGSHFSKIAPKEGYSCEGYRTDCRGQMKKKLMKQKIAHIHRNILATGLSQSFGILWYLGKTHYFGILEILLLLTIMKVGPTSCLCPVLLCLCFLERGYGASHHGQARMISRNHNLTHSHNHTKDGETEVHHRPKRGWIWNQFFVLEEHIGPDAQYVGKVGNVP